MDRFKVGDTVYKARKYSDSYYCCWGGLSETECPIGSIGVITIINGANHFVRFDHLNEDHNVSACELELIKEINMERKFKLLNDMCQIKAGVIVEEKDGNFSYKSTKEFVPYWPVDTEFRFKPEEVINNPYWFEEVKPLFLKISELPIFEAFMKKQKENTLPFRDSSKEYV